jgi:3-oxoacyl-[acyl-carrier protein] reductase
MNYGLENKSVIVTGASKGIGKSIAAAFVAEGANVVLSARTESELNKSASEMRGGPGKVTTVAGDVTQEADRVALVETAKQRFGGLHVLVNNAGMIGAFVDFEHLSLDDWREVFELNVFAVVGLTKLVLPIMREQRWGRIINISSESGVQPDAAMTHYNASKGALNTLTKSLSKAVGADNILVNAVSPAFIKTPLVEEMLENIGRVKGVSATQAEADFLRENRPNIVLRRSGTSDESAGAVVFLASDQASFITGANIRVDGGSIASIAI